MIDKNLIRNCN